jgi:hypothetical protein
MNEELSRQVLDKSFIPLQDVVPSSSFLGEFHTPQFTCFQSLNGNKSENHYSFVLMLLRGQPREQSAGMIRPYHF